MDIAQQISSARGGDENVALEVFNSMKGEPDQSLLALEMYVASAGPFQTDDIDSHELIIEDLLDGDEALFDSSAELLKAFQILVDNKILGVYESDGVQWVDIPQRAVEVIERDIATKARARASERPEPPPVIEEPHIAVAAPGTSVGSPQDDLDMALPAVVGLAVAGFVGWLALETLKKMKS